MLRAINICDNMNNIQKISIDRTTGVVSYGYKAKCATNQIFDNVWGFAQLLITKSNQFDRDELKKFCENCLNDVDPQSLNNMEEANVLCKRLYSDAIVYVTLNEVEKKVLQQCANEFSGEKKKAEG